MEALKLGSNGESVKILQKFLEIEPNGVFGLGTSMALQSYQRKNNLKVTGVVDAELWDHIANRKATAVLPIYRILNTDEDFSDPEEEMSVSVVEETLPTCDDSTALMKLISSAVINRKIKRVVFHCSATTPNATVSAIQKYWKETMKWKSPGYHIIVKADGSWTQLLDFNGISNGVKGLNSDGIHICYIGGIDSSGKTKDTRTEAQKRVLAVAWKAFVEKLPTVTFHGHYEFSSKACPSFNVKNWIAELS